MNKAIKVVTTNIFVAVIIPNFAFVKKNIINGIISVSDFNNDFFSSIFFFLIPLRY